MGFKPFSITVKQEHLEFLKENNIFLSLSGVYERSWMDKLKGKNFKFLHPATIEPYSAFLQNGFFSMGAHSYSKTNFGKDIKVGRYCALGANITIMPSNHPMDRISTSGLDYSNAAIFDKYMADRGGEKILKVPFKEPNKTLPIIGNDVWIGHGAVLGRGIKIGDGAVIGAYSIVTKDVPSYAVVAGVPASIRKYRFEEEIRDALAEISWWDYDLYDIAKYNTVKPLDFIKNFNMAIEQGDIEKVNIRKIALVEELKLL